MYVISLHVRVVLMVRLVLEVPVGLMLLEPA
jgi:hypothetical protein